MSRLSNTQKEYAEAVKLGVRDVRLVTEVTRNKMVGDVALLVVQRR